MAVSPGEIQSSFNPNEHIMQIKNKDYLPVQWRLVWFRSTCPHGSIETEMLHLDLDRDTEEETLVWNAERRRNEKIAKHAKGFVIFRAVVKDGQGGIATGTKSEKAASFPDFIEKAETGAIGRALAALGYGTQFTGDEWDEAHRIVDSPVDNGKPVPSQQEEKKSLLTPEMLREDWAKVYKIPAAQVQERWPKFKVWVLEADIKDEDLKDHHMSLLNGRIEQ